MPGSGSGTFSSQRPRAARLLTRAFIPDVLQHCQPVRHKYESANADYSRSARFGPVESGALALSGLCRGAPSAALGFRLDFSILDTAYARRPNTSLRPLRTRSLQYLPPWPM